MTPLAELIAAIRTNGGTEDDMPKPGDIQDPVARQRLQQELNNYNNNIQNTTWKTYLKNREYIQ